MTTFAMFAGTVAVLGLLALLVCNLVLAREERDDRATGEQRRLMAEIARQPRDGGGL